MHVSLRCAQGAACRPNLACSSRTVIDYGRLDRYKIIRNFFRKQQAFGIVGSKNASSGPWDVQRTEARYQLKGRTIFQACATLHPYGQVRFLHSTLRVRNEKPVRGSIGEERGGVEIEETYQGYSSKKTKDGVGTEEKKQDVGEEQGQTQQYINPENYSLFFRRLMLSLPPMQRPTRDEMLKVATGFWQRLKIRFKWFTIKSFRKFNADDISAFISWFLMSQTVWILLGTTTFFSVIFATANSLSLQEYVARAISDYLTSETGVTIIFESAIVPKWKDSRIAFKNVYISRRPPSLSNVSYFDPNAGHKAAARYDVGNHPAYHGLEEDLPSSSALEIEEKLDYAVYDLNVDSIDVTLSLWHWLDGKGLVKDAVIKGVRGVLDRRFIYYDPDKPLNPADYRHLPQPGDFELESLQLEDLLVTVYQPDAFRPYTFSIFRADIKTFRKQWLFYDFLSAENVVGQFDNCLFSLHKPQSIGRTTEQDLKDGRWSRMTRFRIDGVNVDHVQRASSMEGPISWITSGKFDAVFDIRFPQTEEQDINALIGEIAEAITNAASEQAARLFDRIPGQRELAKPAISTPEDNEVPPVVVVNGAGVVAPCIVSIDIDLRFRDLKATVPIFTRDLSYVNNALIRPIVAFINANKTLVPIRCRVVKDISEFDGAWTMWETGLMDEIALKVYDALAYHVTQANFNQRVRAVSYWSLQKTLAAALSALQSKMQPMSHYLLQATEMDPLVEWGNMPT